MTDTQSSEREEFEAWIKTHIDCWNLERDEPGDGYTHIEEDMAWSAWQAARSRQQSQDAQVREWIAANGPGGWINRMREALKLIANAESIDNVLDPQWAARIARIALDAAREGDKL